VIKGRLPVKQLGRIVFCDVTMMLLRSQSIYISTLSVLSVA